jgi:hypothetical protein
MPPLGICLWLLLLAAATAKAQRPQLIPEPAAAGVTSALRITRFGDTNEGFAQYSGLADSTRFIVRDAASWATYWSRIHRPFIPEPSLPPVDFSREMVVVAALGKRPTGGYTIRIDQATADSSRLVVSVVRTLPGAGCVVAASITQPVDLVRIPSISLPVTFAERVERADCQAAPAPRRPGGI